MQFGLSRSDSQPVTILFFNLGYSDLHLSLIEFSGVEDSKANKTIESLRVIHEEVVRGAGSYMFDKIIMEYIIKGFEEKHKTPARDNYRSVRKVLAVSKKVKESLSASKEVPIFVEGLASGIDFSWSITRAAFNEAAAPLLEVIKKGLSGFLERSGL